MHKLDNLDILRPDLVELITFRIQQQTWKKEDPNSLDYRFWKDNGWLDSNCSFYYPCKSNIFSRVIAQMAGLLTGFFI